MRVSLGGGERDRDTEREKQRMRESKHERDFEDTRLLALNMEDGP